MQPKLLIIISFILFSWACSTTKKTVTHYDSNEDIPSADWSAQDIKTVTTKMLQSILDNPLFKNIKGPMILGLIRNESDEQIDTGIVMRRLQGELIKEGFQFISAENLETVLKNQTLQQSDLFDPAKLNRVGKLIGAKMILQGHIANIRKRDAKQESVVYID